MQNIQLNELETELCESLLKLVNDKELGTQMRIAGGWVRDKLLGLDSCDIDIALDNMSGEAFATLFSSAVGASSIGKIKANPEASKHLETACVRFKGIDIDFVNLRSEDYSQDSRIPTIVSNKQKIGTPLEDALRRDLTINSLFFNINERKIEDFSGFGLSDLENRIARTPLEPLTTFLDDPLRVLRTIRFVSRFNLNIVPEVEQAMQNPQVIQFLIHKISRERVYKEFTLMMKGKNHQRSLRLLKTFNLINVIFKVPEGIPSLLNEGFSLIERLQFSHNENNFILISAGILLFYGNENFTVQRNKKPVPVFEVICEDLKMTNYEILSISGIITSNKSMVEVFDEFNAIKLADIIRKTKENWELCLVLAAYFKYNSVDAAENQIKNIKELANSLQIQQIWLEKPLVNVITI